MAARNSSGLVAYVNARLLDPATGLDTRGALLTNGETIADVGPGLFQGGVPSGMEVVDCKGLCLAPGLVDMRVQLREPGEEHKETLKSAGEAAVAGGVTSMVCLPNTNPVIDEVATVEFVARRARKIGLAKVYPYAAATKRVEGKELAEMGMLAEAGALGFTDGLKAIRNAQVMRRALTYAATFGLLIVQHPEEPSLAEGGMMNEGELATRMGLSGIPVAAEAIMLERDMRLVEITNGRYHAAHVATAAGVEIIRKAKAKGLPVTCDTAPPYFALNELAVKDYRTFAKLSPPLRSETDRQAVVEGLKDGTIDAVASDHSPQDQDSKRVPFAVAEFGGVGLETLLPVTLDLAHNGHMSLIEALRLITCAPSAILNLAAGRLKVGAAADLVLFDPDRGWKVNAKSFHSKSKNSPFDDRPVQGMVMRTIVDGRTVYTHDA
ncbi:dihydroorotase [Paramagnetospirillum magneticum]|uniref:Dihydroorotase n=1 Tax=Paramagnetospirillum magneticum (strain ATCC 700264 / AMB-1) TaxID=342108 RepID=Q2W157_PARM1|nr:dihydroorotase [Paramagnetospirillum magneticum]BAE52418.1 Dihydroorotase and related cyclic amidohydrolase [Paramagnetospirillum magneticum AMB-1]